MMKVDATLILSFGFAVSPLGAVELSSGGPKLSGRVDFEMVRVKW
jgi:hypothetical protein